MSIASNIGTPIDNVNRNSDLNIGDNLPMNIGDRVREARKEKGLSQGQLATRIGIRQPTLSDLENGESASTSHIAKIASVLEVSALWLETGRGPKNHVAAVNDEDDELGNVSQLIALYKEATTGGRELILTTARNVAKRGGAIDVTADKL